MKSKAGTVPNTLRKIGVIPLAAVIFFTVSGGPYGIEPLIGYAGILCHSASDDHPASL